MSVAYYCTVRYVPSMVRQEHINIGVVVISSERSYADCRFTSDWQRPQRFGREDVSYLRSFAERLTNQISRQSRLFGPEPLRAEMLSEMASEWQNSIQFSPLVPALTDRPADLLDELFESLVAHPKGRDLNGVRRSVLRRTRLELHEQLHKRFGDRSPELRSYGSVQGELDSHKFDIVVQNGRPWIGVDAISFEGAPSEERQDQVKLAILAARDVRERLPDMRVGVTLIRPDSPRRDFERAVDVLARAHVETFSPSEIDEWVRAAVSNLPPEAAHHAGAVSS